jgi:uncharacterized protein YhaN
MELKIRPTPLTDGLLRDDDLGFNFCAIKMLDHARQMERERAYLLEKDASNRATMDTLKEQLKADEKAAYDLRCLLHEVADHCGISTALWPSAVADRLKQMKDDKDEIETMWEELTKAIGANGKDSDPLTGRDTNEDIHKRAMDLIGMMVSDEF